MLSFYLVNEKKFCSLCDFVLDNNDHECNIQSLKNSIKLLRGCLINICEEAQVDEEFEDETLVPLNFINNARKIIGLKEI